MDHIDLQPIARMTGTVKLPGSKSISNRSLLLAALAEGVTELTGLLVSEDTTVMREALRVLGVHMEAGETAETLRVFGVGGRFRVREADLFLGNAGTAFRPLTAVLALQGGHYRLSGVPRMHERPIGDLVDALRGLEANIAYLGNEGFPPLEIRPAHVAAGDRVRIRGDVSSQFLSALLMALPLLGRAVTVEVEGELISKPYVDITLNLMARFGVNVGREDWRAFFVPAGARYTSPGRFEVEGDASSASYFLAAGVIAGGPVRVEGVGRGSVQGDVRFTEVLTRMGGVLTLGENWIEAAGPRKLLPIDEDLNHIPDAAMTAACAALFAEGTSRIRNIGSWRVKETDRISAMATELAKVGAEVEAGPDWLAITPPRALRPWAEIDTYDDHRMAMCFALVALGGVPVRIRNPGCVAKTFPDFFEVFLGLAAPDVPVIAIDGPSASGKGTVASRVAKRLGFQYLDSGALYRLVALVALERGIPWDDEKTLARVAAGLDVRFDGDEVYLGARRVTDEIRTERVGEGASRVAALPSVRQALLSRQRAFRRPPGLVADGRDMGSVVFPDAKLKVFLTASLEARAQRRYKQLMEKGMSANIQTLLQDIQCRDARDAERSAAPLQKTRDAVLLDTTLLTIDEAVEAVLERYSG